MRLIDADELMGKMLGEDVFDAEPEFDSETRRKIVKHIRNAPTALEVKSLEELLEKTGTDFCGVKFLSLEQVKRVIWEWRYG